jgi:hypothetical protein
MNHNEMVSMLEKYNTYAPAGRCWWTCVSLLKRMPKAVRSRFVLVHGKADGRTHYWIREGAEISDPHYEIIDHSVSDYEEVESYDPDFVISKIDTASYEERDAYNIHGRERWQRVPHVDIDGGN